MPQWLQGLYCMNLYDRPTRLVMLVPRLALFIPSDCHCQYAHQMAHYTTLAPSIPAEEGLPKDYSAEVMPLAHRTTVALLGLAETMLPKDYSAEVLLLVHHTTLAPSILVKEGLPRCRAAEAVLPRHHSAEPTPLDRRRMGQQSALAVKH